MLNEFLEQLYWTAWPHSWGDVVLYAVTALVAWAIVRLIPDDFIHQLLP